MLSSTTTTTDDEKTLVGSPSTIPASGKPRRAAAARGSRSTVGTPGRHGKKKAGGGSKLFEGMTFLLTQGTRWRELPLDDETEEEEEVQEGDIRPNTSQEKSFSRSGLRQMIVENGGKVLAACPDGAKEPMPPNVVVVTDRACQTMTYILALVYGYPRINFAWVHNCLSAR